MAPFEPFSLDGVSGTLAPEARAEAEAWIRGGGHRAGAIKEAVRLGRVFAKVYRDDGGLLGRLLSRGRTRARREFRNLASAHAAGAPVPRPLGFVEWRQGGAVLSETVQGRTLLESLPEGFPARADALRAAGRVVKSLGDAGVRHGDLHQANVLSTGAGLVVVDLQTVDVDRLPTPEPARAEAAASLAASMQGSLSTAEAAQLFRAAGLGRASMRSAFRTIGRLRARYAERRARRSLDGADGFRIFRHAEWRVVAAPGTDERRAVEWLSNFSRVDPDGWLGQGVQARAFHRVDQARRVWLAAMRLRFARLPGPELTLLAASPERGLVVRRSPPGAVSLDEWLGSGDREARRAEFEAFVRVLHSRGVSGMREFLVQPRLDGRQNFAIAEAEGVRLRPSVPASDRLEDLKECQKRLLRLARCQTK